MIPYIFHVTVIITACFLFYKLLLQKETFFRLNRWTLLTCVGISFTLPLLPVPRQWSWRSTDGLARFLQITTAAPDTKASQGPQTSQGAKASPVTTQTTASTAQPSGAQNTGPAPIIPTGPSITDSRTANPSAHVQPKIAANPAQPSPGSSPSPTLILYWLYLFGVSVFGGNLLLQIIVLLYQSYTRPVVQDGPFRIVETTGDRAPCSFGHNIFINPSKYDWETYNQILLHEKIHASGRHTIDILLAEILIVWQWFNPFAWLYRKEVENNLEFLTDHSLLQTHSVEPSVYQLSLLKVAAPNLPYNITTNYNQSLLKRRIIMMNSKRSSLHTIWKYFFLLPLLTCLVCAFNKPIASGQSNNIELTRSSGPFTTSGQGTSSMTSDTSAHPDRKEGSWFATTKGDKLCFELKGDNDDHSWSNNTCILKSELTPRPGVGKTEFRLVREAGVITFTGQFDGEQGYGHYSFKQDENYARTVHQKGFTSLTEDDMLVFFLLNIKNDYIDMLQHNGYPHVSKNNLIAMSAMHIDLPFIQSWKSMGYTDISENDIIAVKAMHIDKDYVEDLRTAGYANMKISDLLAFKAQGIDGEYVTRLNKAQGAGAPASPAVATSPATAASPGAAAASPVPRVSPQVRAAAHANAPVPAAPTPGAPAVTAPVVTPIPAGDIIAFKSLDIDSPYLASLKAAGYDNISMENLITLRSMGITPDFINSFRNIGFKDISAEQLPALKSLGITPDFVKSFREIGYKDISLDQLPALKSLGITPDFVKSFRSIGFNNISLDQLPALKSMGVTAAYVTEMKGKGFVSDDLNKYIQLKSAFQ